GSVSHCFIFFEDGGFLQLDFLHQLIRKDLVYLNAAEVLAQRRKNKEGIYTYNTSTLLEHLVLFNFLNGAGLKEKYIGYFQTLPGKVQQSILSDFNAKYGTSISEVSALGEFQSSVQDRIVAYLKQQKVNKGFARLKNKFRYWKDTIRDLRHNKGLIITFSGVDGAGKSTILFETRDLLQEKYRQKVVVLRHRPSVLPIISALKYGKEEAEKRSVAKLPRQGTNKSSLGSLVRFGYYYVDYLFGQWHIYFKYILRGYIVLYDRYYFDFIVDHKRSNIQIAPAIPKFLYRFLFKPNVNFFLYAAPEVILKRKKELDAPAIEKLTKEYRQLFENLERKKRRNTRYVVIENIDKQETLHTIFDHFQNVA
ncbi:MAG: hypothetical protein AAF598_15000, partial [Bacteroidota bacterium]